MLGLRTVGNRAFDAATGPTMERCGGWEETGRGPCRRAGRRAAPRVGRSQTP
ncbi:MAG: hypothetical protein AVDCRST_MAG49-605 [uncultured Thermomicrobiales bacterium]|uniref:Uncharacterized protein n=1 Tax=uncultured Thermomicrobiales bacterium TaxID=1645740 RepID=A0A6J4U1X3_9BACT|nr:MAG: hypothetical protein AVDCRST_MAG49-605 [uncultured Thermomicrobiales bacterium]